MSKKLSKLLQNRLEKALSSVGDMALKRRARRIVEELELKNGDHILDIGCGNGYYLSLLNRLGFKFKLTGVDNDKRGLLDAKRFISDSRVKLIFASAEKLPLKDESFDKIIISEVIEHVQDDRVVLKEIKRVLKRGGLLLLTTCNINYPFLWDPINWILQHIFKTHIKRGFWSGIWNQHLRMYNQKDLEKLIKDVNFKISLSEILTSWCLPFNHYIVNLVARLIAKYIYLNKISERFAKGLTRFKNDEQPFLLKSAFHFVNMLDKLNDLIPQDFGVSIFVKAKRI